MEKDILKLVCDSYLAQHGFSRREMYLQGLAKSRATFFSVNQVCMSVTTHLLVNLDTNAQETRLQVPYFVHMCGWDWSGEGQRFLSVPRDGGLGVRRDTDYF